MSEEDLLKIFNTMSFNGGNVKEARLIDDNKIYLVMFNQPDLIFYFKSMNDWSLQTAVNYVDKPTVLFESDNEFLEGD